MNDNIFIEIIFHMYNVVFTHGTVLFTIDITRNQRMILYDTKARTHKNPHQLVCAEVGRLGFVRIIQCQFQNEPCYVGPLSPWQGTSSG
jgi:hypothetical protein